MSTQEGKRTSSLAEICDNSNRGQVVPAFQIHRLHSQHGQSVHRGLKTPTKRGGLLILQCSFPQTQPVHKAQKTWSMCRCLGTLALQPSDVKSDKSLQRSATSRLSVTALKLCVIWPYSKCYVKSTVQPIHCVMHKLSGGVTDKPSSGAAC